MDNKNYIRIEENTLKANLLLSILGAITFIVSIISFPILPGFGYLKIDLSDVVILFSAMHFKKGGIFITAGIRFFLNLIFFGMNLTNIIGEGSALIASLVFCLSMYALLISNENSSLFIKIRSVLISSLLLTFVMGVVNAFVTTPLYMKLIGFDIGMSMLKYILVVITPFNLIKGGIVGVFFLTIFTKLKSIRLTK